jgi:hypothetical protein
MTTDQAGGCAPLVELVSSQQRAWLASSETSVGGRSSPTRHRVKSFVCVHQLWATANTVYTAGDASCYLPETLYQLA